MSIKDILVHVDTSPASDRRAQIAVDLALRFEARLTGIGLDNTVAEDSFRALLRQAELAGEWRSGTDLPETFVSRQAGAADLVIVGQYDPDAPPPDALASPEDVILACGRPVLVVPHAGRFERVGGVVLVAWNGSREATRAAHDALDLMTMSSRVTVLSANPDLDEDWETEEVALHLARHGVSATAEVIDNEDLSVSDLIQSRAAAIDADLIVMGAYGRSRLREMILGGATRNILGKMKVPVLMSH